MAKRASVLVVGAGPTGLTLACQLQRHGVRCRHIELLETPTTTSRALGVQPRTVELLDSLGLAKDAIEAGLRLKRGELWAGDRRLISMDLSQVSGTPFAFFLVLPQADMEALLDRHLRRLGGRVERGVKLTRLEPGSAGVNTTLEHSAGRQEVAKFDWVIGCDGAHSVVRHQLGMAFEGERVTEDFVLADVRVEGPFPEDTSRTWFNPDGILASVPMRSGLVRFIADLPPGRSWPAEPTLELIQELVNTRGLPATRIRDAAWISRFSLNGRMVDKYRVGRSLLVGDAAHIHSPVGGLGMNTGMQDATNLGWKLALVATRSAPEELLDSYHLERHPVARGVIEQTSLLTRVFAMHGRLGQSVRNEMMAGLANLGFLQKMALAQLGQLEISYRHSPIVEDVGDFLGFHAGPAAGDRAPDVQLNEGDSLYSTVRSERHALLVFEGLHGDGGETVAAARKVQARFGDRIDVNLVKLSADGAGTWEGGLVSDPLGVVHHHYGAGSPCAYLIRPDEHVGFRSSLEQLDRLDPYLARVFNWKPQQSKEGASVPASTA